MTIHVEVPHVQRIDDAVLAVVRAVLDRPDAAMHDAFLSIGGSLQAAQRVVAQLQHRLCADIAPHLLLNSACIGDFADTLIRALNDGLGDASAPRPLTA
ncbi:phosphopantetheine-binding protein [Burkholderia thailandensis]|uniref:Acyl carrier protein n=2 Tax=Burkholderia thailandensis TaxID=57975 RepID=A0AAW9CRY8_BURTH|nr:phosphopantetheine-binding protein [Burkholderia thailandensis]ABC36200.1 conserved hypothetical protein [Burkholderia thailandensis E264]AHI67357.1 hypothetical protein BTL_3952 [Burkholderia thailandensis H0587]AHI75896.1 hypothetical protein BTQ_4507 [Burkholderia thailandensis 2002721723]AIP29283.1 hypothetical protein DR63_4557 [Burkholderia thailandensis E264]AIP65651.1 hypothetical protein DR62_3744 [Burkholderia thailandensis]